MNEAFDLEAHIARGVERIVSDALRATARDPRESLFLAKFAAACRRATKTRQRLARQGEHIPSFLIASITSACNLHCAGCYSRCTEATTDCAPVRQLSAADWTALFREAEELGVSFILLAGGEPMLRRDVIEAAGERRDLLFPIFTNGTCFGARDWQLLDRCRNLIPVLSLEGGRERTDRRRGAGVYDRLLRNMAELQTRGLLFGASVTVTTENLEEVTSPAFLEALTERGCKLVIYVEYVPMTEDSRALAPGEAERSRMASAMAELRRRWPELLLLSFPGDERADGGCMAAGRGFIHINSHGGAEPCPFSPYSDMNVKERSLREALRSPLFRALREGDFLDDEHVGGCVLFEKRGQVEALLRSGGSDSRQDA